MFMPVGVQEECLSACYSFVTFLLQLSAHHHYKYVSGCSMLVFWQPSHHMCQSADFVKIWVICCVLPHWVIACRLKLILEQKSQQWLDLQWLKAPIVLEQSKLVSKEHFGGFRRFHFSSYASWTCRSATIKWISVHNAQLRIASKHTCCECTWRTTCVGRPVFTRKQKLLVFLESVYLRTQLLHKACPVNHWQPLNLG